MHKQIYVNLPVKDLARSKAFFEAVGYRFNPQFTNDKGAGMELGENLYAMLLSEEFARTFVVLCDDPKFATDLLDPQVMQVVLDTKGVVDFQTRGRFLLLTTSHLEPEPMVGLLRVAERFVEHVPSVVWEVYGRFPDGMGTEDMPGPPPNRTTVDQWGLSGYGAVEGATSSPTGVLSLRSTRRLSRMGISAARRSGKRQAAEMTKVVRSYSSETPPMPDCSPGSWRRCWARAVSVRSPRGA